MATLQERMALAKKHYELTRGKKFKNTDLADYCGISKASIGLWFNGPTKELDGINLTKASEFLGVNHKWLAGESAPMVIQDNENKGGFNNVRFTDLSVKKIPILDLVQAGQWREVVYDGVNPRGHSFTVYEGKDPKAVFSVQVEGMSMSDKFMPGDELVVDAALEPQPGDFVIAQNGDYDVTFKKYRVIGFDEDGREIFELVPLNPDFPAYNSKQHPISIIGVVVRHAQKFRK